MTGSPVFATSAGGDDVVANVSADPGGGTAAQEAQSALVARPPARPIPVLPQRSPSRAGLVRNVRVGRQGIYDGTRTLLAYELLFRAYEGQGHSRVAAERATSQVIASTFGTFGLNNIANGRPVFINFTRAFLTGIIPIPVESQGVVIEVLERVAVDDELIAGLIRLKDEGYRIAACDFMGDPERSALLELVDYVKVDVTDNPPIRLAEIAAQVKGYGAALVATQVNDEDAFQHCIELGFELFQGSLLQRPTLLERRTLSPSQLICMRLLNDLADPDAPITRIERMVGSDPGLTLRLLRTANSAASGLSNAVTSLRQALVIIGPRRLRSWIVLTLVEGGPSTSSTDGVWSVLARAFACQRLGGDRADLAFTIGLLSGAAELLGVVPESVADGAGVSDEARNALLEGAGDAGRALVAVLAHERDDDEGVASTGLLPFDVSRAYLESLSESLKLVTELNSQ
jgi:EAL and modified HD-GYP domain-containing signal transduction protein